MAPLKVVMDHIAEAFNQPRKARSGADRTSTERMVWGKEGLGSWVALLADQVRGEGALGEQIDDFVRACMFCVCVTTPAPPTFWTKSIVTTGRSIHPILSLSACCLTGVLPSYPILSYALRALLGGSIDVSFDGRCSLSRRRLKRCRRWSLPPRRD